MNKNIPFLSLKDIDAPIAAELKEAAHRVIDSGIYLHGENTHAFEAALASKCGVPFCVGVSNGLDALRLIFRALIETGRLAHGDGVLVPANTYIASILPLTEFRLNPVLIEPDPTTFGIDWQKAMKRFHEYGDKLRIRALLTVHLYGNPSWNENVASTLRSNGVTIVEDNAQAIGASVKRASGEWISTGALGDAAAFSFYPTKNIGALGDAGAVTTSCAEIADTVRAIANYGCDRRYHNVYCGYNCRLDEMQAALLRVKLHRLEEISGARRHTAGIYLDSISNPDVTLPTLIPDTHQVWHQFPILCKHRDELRDFLSVQGIATDIHYAVPPHLQPCYEGRFSGSFPVTESIADRIVSLPIAGISDEDTKKVARAVTDFKPYK